MNRKLVCVVCFGREPAWRCVKHFSSIALTPLESHYCGKHRFLLPQLLMANNPGWFLLS